MRIPFAYQPHLCAGSGGLRYAPSTFRVREAGGRVVVDVTDGRMAITVPVTLDPEERPGGIYPASILAQARAYELELFHESDDAFETGRDQPVTYGVRLESDRVASFEREDGTKVVATAPDDAFFPAVESCVPTGEPAFVLNLSAERLRLLAEAMGDGGEAAVELQWFEDKRAMVVRLANDLRAGTVALLMPMTGGGAT